MPLISTNKGPLALLGGTFDPIHYGHIKPALALADTLNWQAIYLQPTCHPPHRASAPRASAQQRLEMVKLAASLDQCLVADDWELQQGKPSRTINTLQHMRQQHPDETIHFIIGMDSFLALTSWLQWREILQLTHLVVLPRPGYTLASMPPELAEVYAIAATHEPARMQSGSGRIFIADTPRVDVSATRLREALKNARQCPDFLPEPVFQYIRKHGLYQ